MNNTHSVYQLDYEFEVEYSIGFFRKKNVRQKIIFSDERLFLAKSESDVLKLAPFRPLYKGERLPLWVEREVYLKNYTIIKRKASVRMVNDLPINSLKSNLTAEDYLLYVHERLFPQLTQKEI